MDEDYTVKVVNVSEVPLIGADTRIVRATHVTIMIGRHGPFSKDFYPPNNTTEAINAWKIQQQQHIQSIAS
jgi:hypothetical protein